MLSFSIFFPLHEKSINFPASVKYCFDEINSQFWIFSNIFSHAGRGPSILISSLTKLYSPDSFFLKGKYIIFIYLAWVGVLIKAIPFSQWCISIWVSPPMIPSIIPGFNLSVNLNMTESSSSLKHLPWIEDLLYISNFIANVWLQTRPKCAKAKTAFAPFFLKLSDSFSNLSM